MQEAFEQGKAQSSQQDAVSRRGIQNESNKGT